MKPASKFFCSHQKVSKTICICAMYMRERDEEEVRILITAKQQEDEKVEFLHFDLF